MSYNALVNQMKCIIKSLESGKEFYLSDIISNPPAGLGRILYNGVADSSIPDVTCLGRIGDAEKYRKN